MHESWPWVRVKLWNSRALPPEQIKTNFKNFQFFWSLINRVSEFFPFIWEGKVKWTWNWDLDGKKSLCVRKPERERVCAFVRVGEWVSEWEREREGKLSSGQIWFETWIDSDKWSCIIQQLNLVSALNFDFLRFIEGLIGPWRGGSASDGVQ